MKTLGILGGGQLARMLVLAGAPLGVRFRIVDKAADACAGQLAPLSAVGWDDVEKLEGFAREIDAATFDFENVPAATAVSTMSLEAWCTECTWAEATAGIASEAARAAIA